MRTSYQVGRPWMLEGKMFFGLTASPMRNNVLAKMVLALAEPEPLTVANFTTKSLMPLMSEPALPSAQIGVVVHQTSARRLRFDVHELLHVPGPGRTALGTQPAVQAHVLVLGHDATGLEGAGDVEVLTLVARRYPQAGAQAPFIGVADEIDAINRADVHAGIAFDAQRRGKYRLHVAIEAAFGLLEGQLIIEPEFDLDLEVAQRPHLVGMRHANPPLRGVIVLIGPLVNAHLLAEQAGAGRGALFERLAVAEQVDRHRRLVAVRHRPDDVFRPPGRVAAEEHAGPRRHHRRLIDLGHVRLIELDADGALDPREAVLLADRHQHVVAGKHHLLARGLEPRPAAGVDADLAHLLEADARQPAVLEHDLLGGMVVEDRHAFVLGILDLPRRGFHDPPRRAYRHFHVLAAEAQRGAAAIHGRVAATDHHHALADPADVLEGDAGQPIDADVNVGGGLPAAEEVEVLALGGAAANEDRIETLAQQRRQGVNLAAKARLHAKCQDAIDLLVEDRLRQPEGGNVGAHQAVAARVLLKQHATVAERHQIARHRQGGGAGADERDAFTVLFHRDLRHEGVDLALVVGGNALQSADGDRLFLDAAAPAGGLAGPIADPAEDARKDVALPVQHVGRRIALVRDEANVFRHRRVGRTGPLTIDDLMEVVRIGGVGWGHLAHVCLRDFARQHCRPAPIFVLPQPPLLQDPDVLSQQL